MKIQLRTRKKRREPVLRALTFKDLHACDRRKGSAAAQVSPVVTVPHTAGQGIDAAASQHGRDVVMNHVLV
ncbi:hypothetical protein [Methylobacterium sp. J-077]|uniref:hypothetical protein n=1 Tax=Methylobacterium sp. J-077 TaxID=2836656 RepID=UPI001FBBC636|nr:hypothetical protein [Methylobacterium sp. J-077]MCJ2122402.1 hypothetical protein [Methylobacterium sp. J-077]